MPGKRSDPAKLRRDAAKIRQDQQRRKEQAENLDNRRPPTVSPPAGRVYKPKLKRYPVIKGGAVTGYRKGNNTA